MKKYNPSTLTKTTFLLLFLSVVSSFGQNYPISNNTPVTTCSGTFTDSNALSEGRYQDGESFTKTFTSDNGGYLRFNFTSFEIEDCGSTNDQYDYLAIYDGPEAIGTPIGVYCGSTSPGTITSSGTSLTFVFFSDDNGNGGDDYLVGLGWSATISCIVNPCTDPAGLDTDNDGINDVCDVDDDNDGILDTEECSSSYEDINESGGESIINFSKPNVSFAVFDFLELDNSVSITVNSNPLNANNILQLQANVTTPNQVYIQFLDETFIDRPWISNINGLPRFQITIDSSGNVRVKGTRNTNSTSLELMKTGDGSPFNLISFASGNNDFEIVNQDSSGGDAIKCTATITSCDGIDTDNDTVFNHLDTDSDNDGCPDAVEGAGTIIPSQLTPLTGGSVGGSLYNLGTDSDDEGNPKLNVADANGFVQATATAVLDDNEKSACTADLSLTKTVNSALPKKGDIITYTLTLRNSGPLSATNINVTDVIPLGLTYDIDNSGGAYDGVNTWTIGTLNSGSSVSITITGEVTGTGKIINTAQIISSDQLDIDATPNNGG